MYKNNAIALKSIWKTQATGWPALFKSRL